MNINIFYIQQNGNEYSLFTEESIDTICLNRRSEYIKANNKKEFQNENLYQNLLRNNERLTTIGMKNNSKNKFSFLPQYLNQEIK